jgi:hypothetical protein
MCFLSGDIIYAGGDTSKNFALDGHDLWPSISTGTVRD